MTDPIKLELKEKDLNPGANTLKELKDFKKDFEAKLTEAKNKKTLEEAKALFPDVTFFYDAKDRVLQIGDITMQATSPEQWNEWMSKMAADITALNIELASLESQMKVEQDRILQEEKDKQKKLADEVKDNTSTEIDFSQKIKEKSWVSNFLTGNTTLEQAIDDKNDIELDAFRKTLLEALKKGQSEYKKVFDNGGAATFNKKEWYTLQFIEAHKDELSKKDKKIDWRAMKTEFNKGLDANGEPIEKVADKPTNKNVTPTEKQPTEKTFAEMTNEEKILKAQEAMETLKTLQVTQERSITGTMINVVDVSAAQLSALQSVADLGGADFGYNAVGYEPTRADRANDRYVEKTQKLMNKGKYGKALKWAEKTNERFTEQRKALQKINAYSQNFANERNRASYNKNVANNAMNLAKGPGYAGVTMDVIPYAPLFRNICQNVRALSDRGHLTMDVIGLGPVQVRAPERYKLAFNDAMNGFAGQYGLDGQYALGQGSNGRGINQVESFITEHTRMTPDQAKSLTNGLLLGGGAMLLWKGISWVFGIKSKPLTETRYGRLGIVGASLWGANKLSQMGTGHGLYDVLHGLYTGKTTFQDLWDGTYAKYPLNSPENLAGTTQTYNQIFRNVPFSSILPFTEKGRSGYPEVKDINGMITQLKLIEVQTVNIQEKAAIHSQISFLESLAKSSNGKDILNQAFINMGLDYDKMKKNPDANANSLSDEITERLKKYKDYLVEKGVKISESVKGAVDKLLAYLQTGKPTLDDLAKDGCFEKDNTPNPHTQDLSDPFVKFDTDGKKIDVDPKTVLDKSLWGIDLPLAKKLHLAQRALAGKSIDVKFKVDEKTNVLYLTSVGMMTPVMYDNDGWYIGGESANGGGDPGVNHVNRFPTRFDNAENALWVAHLTNRLINDFSGKYGSVNKPFSASGEYRDLMVGKTSILESFTNTEALDSGTAKSLGGDEFSRNIKGYANYLNGINNTNGESIWSEKGKVGYDLRASFVENWGKSAMGMPKLKKEDEYKGTPDKKNEKPNEKPTNPTEPKPNEKPEDANRIKDSKEVKERALSLKKEFGGKDGGSEKDPTARYDMPDLFFEAWATAYLEYGEGNGPQTFTFNYIDGNKKQKAILYKRQVGKKAPIRVSEEEGKR